MLVRAAAIILIVQASSALAETHTVTVTRDNWFYRDSRSGRGESKPVRLDVRVGDTVRFRQTVGRHGIVLYRSKKSGIGRSIEVTQGIQIASGKLTDRLSTGRTFRHENLCTSIFEGVADHLTIRIGSDFKGPLYFADRTVSPRTGVRSFGVMHLATGERTQPVVPAVFSMKTARNILAVGRNPWSDSRNLGSLGGNPSQQFVVPGEPGGTVDFMWGNWFEARLVADKGLSPFRRGVFWQYATSHDIDGDKDLDVIALITRTNGDKPRSSWWLLVNGTRTNRQSISKPADLLGTRRSFVSALELLALGDQKIRAPMFAGVADFNGDNRIDVYLSSAGTNNRIAVLHQRLSLDVPGYSFEKKQVVDTEIVMDIAPPRFSYPVDVNSDGFSDLLVSGDKRSAVFINRPGRGFSSTDATAGSLSATSVSRIGLDDLNKDQLFELVVETVEGEFQAFSKSAAGSFQLIKKKE